MGCDTKIADGTEIDVLGHDSETVAAKAATCREAGNISYWHCKTCDKYFSNKECTEEITQEDTLISATGHEKAEITGAKEASCTAEGYTGDKICTICKEVIEKGTITKKKAHTYKEGKCTVCGTADPNYKASDSKKQSATTVTGSSVDSNKTNNSNTNSPQTGDNTQAVLWVVLMAGAIFVIAGSLIVYKKKQ